MGMFDNISVSDQLPYSEEMIALGLNKNVWVFQTKDLENTMDSYFIQEGKLFKQCFKTETWVGGNEKAKDWLDRLGHLERNDPFLLPVLHHGEIYFYEFVTDVQDKYDCWIEFKAIFTEGILNKIELVKFTKEENTERKQRETEWEEERKRKESIWYNKYFLYTRPYRWFAFKIWYKTFNRLGNFFLNLSHKL